MKRKPSTILCGLGLLGLVAAAMTAEVAATPTPLEPGVSVERDLAPGEKHEFRVDLRAGRYVLLVVDQRGIDVVVRLFDPQGERILEVDGSGKEGLEPLSFFNRLPGPHRIEVVPFDDEAPAGRYAIGIERLERAARKPARRVDQLMARWDRPDSPGAALAVVRDGKIVYKRGYGSAQLEYAIPITPSTIFHVASVSKQFTAFATALLAEQGKLSLDDDVRKHLPEVPDFGKTITLRHLIHHTSGLRDQWNLLALGGWRLDDVITLEHILTMVRHQEELNFDPGEEFLYCNTGYTLLGEVVARVTGKSFREWTTENMFRPLGMTDTHFHDDHQMIVPGRAYSYAAEGGGFRKSVLSYANAGATSLFTTVEDLARWSHNLDTGEVGGETVIRQMHEPGVLNDGEELSYAFGLGLGEHRGLRTVAHAGGDAGFRSYLVRYPGQRLAVAVLSNLGDLNPGGLARQVAEVYLEEEMRAAESASPEEASAGEGERAATVEIDPALLDDYAGDYRLQEGPLVAVAREDGRLVARTAGRPEVTLVPESESVFHIREIDARVTFHREESGEVRRFTLLLGGRETPGERIERVEPTAEQLAGYAGEYYSPELGTFYSIAVQDGRLVALHRRHGEIELSPLAQDEFSGNTWFFGRVQFERDGGGAVTVMRVSSGRVRGLRFGRRPPP